MASYDVTHQHTSTFGTFMPGTVVPLASWWSGSINMPIRHITPEMLRQMAPPPATEERTRRMQAAHNEREADANYRRLMGLLRSESAEPEKPAPPKTVEAVPLSELMAGAEVCPVERALEFV